MLLVLLHLLIHELRYSLFTDKRMYSTYNNHMALRTICSFRMVTSPYLSFASCGPHDEFEVVEWTLELAVQLDGPVLGQAVCVVTLWTV